MSKIINKTFLCPSCNKPQKFELFNKSENGYISYFRCLTCNHVLTKKGNNYD